jgi:hypothetical protein
MKRRLFLGTLAAAVLAFATFASARGDQGPKKFEADLVGPEETPSSLSTTGHGHLRLRIDDNSEAIEYELSYEDLEGVAPTVPGGVVLFSHIHFGQRRTSGGVSAFLCGGGSKGACPTPSGTVEGTIVPADVVGPAGQGIGAGEFAELVRAIRTGYTYANVHTTKYPSGEIRGQIRNGNGHDGDGNDSHDQHHDH